MQLAYASLELYSFSKILSVNSKEMILKAANYFWNNLKYLVHLFKKKIPFKLLMHTLRGMCLLGVLMCLKVKLSIAEQMYCIYVIQS